MGSVNELERLISNCSINDDLETFYMDETEITFVTTNNLPCDEKVFKFENDKEDQSVYGCSEKTKCFNKVKDQRNLSPL